MHRLLLLVASLVVLGSAQASEVFVTKDAQGRPIYTDRPTACRRRRSMSRPRSPTRLQRNRSPTRR